MLQFNLRQLEAFVAAADQGSFTRAAQTLYLTQSTVSAHIQTLEKALGQPLFTRDSKKSASLTEAGRNAYPQAKEILRRCQALQSAFLAPDGPQILELAASTVPCQCLLPKLMAGFLAQYAGCRYQLRKGDSTQVHRWLTDGQVRIGFVGARLDETRFRYHPLLLDKLVVVTANTPIYRDLHAQGCLGPELLSEPLILREEGSGTRRWFDAYLQNVGINRDTLRIVAEIDQPETILSSVASGLGVTVCSALAAQELLDNGHLLAFDLNINGFYRELCLAAQRDTVLTTQEQAFWDFAVASAPNL